MGDLSNWDQHPNGDIQVRPLVGYQTAAAAGAEVLLQLRTANSQQELDDGNLLRIQLFLSADQARGLAAELTKMANEVAGYTSPVRQ